MRCHEGFLDLFEPKKALERKTNNASKKGVVALLIHSIPVIFLSPVIFLTPVIFLENPNGFLQISDHIIFLVALAKELESTLLVD